MGEDQWGKYLRAKEPGMREKAYAWKTAIGLQKVDGLTPSEYLIKTAQRNIEGEITLAESRQLVSDYHKAKKLAGGGVVDRSAEADLVSQHIAEVLSEDSFTFSPEGLVSIHRRLFEGVFEFAGRIRDYDITKDEWVLDGDTVRYGSSYRLMEMLTFDIKQEREFSYVGLTESEIIRHISRFTSNLWQIHAFGEGNTRTTGVFVIKSLRTLGFDVANDVFAENAWYFRNALVRANYTNIPRGVHPTLVYLERFFSNLLLGRSHELKSRYLHISCAVPKSEFDILSGEQVREQVGEQEKNVVVRQLAAKPSKFVQKLLRVMKGEMTVLEMMTALKLGGRRNFLERYLIPAIDTGLVEMTQPDSPRSPTQRYRLTASGQKAKTGCENSSLAK